MIKWAINCNTTIEMKLWEFLWKVAWKIVIPTNIKENLFKMVYRWHITPKELSYMNKDISNKCWKCKTQEDSYFHMWWTCTRAKIYWSQIHKCLCQASGYDFEKSPEIYLVGLKMEQFIKEDRLLMCYSIATARILFVQKWRLTECSTIEN